MIDYLSGQDGSILPAWDYLPCPVRKNFPKSQIINPLVTELVGQDSWILALFFFHEFMDLNSVLFHKHAKKELGQYPPSLTSRLVNNPGLLVGRGKKSQISRDFQGQICGKNGRISWELLLPKQISLESDWFCADLRKVFSETRRSYIIYSGFIPQYEIVLYK